MIEFFFKKFSKFKGEVRVLGRNLGHEGSRDLERIKCRRIKKTKCDQVFL